MVARRLENPVQDLGLHRFGCDIATAVYAVHRDDSDILAPEDSSSLSLDIRCPEREI